jgi:hypothetical protein
MASELWYFAATAPPSQPSKTVPSGAPEGLVEAQLFDVGRRLNQLGSNAAIASVAGC